MRSALPRAITADKLIPVARRLTPATAAALAEALSDAGLRTLEVTIEGESGVRSIHALADSGLTVGAGTVGTVAQAEAAVGAGAAFLVSPHFDPRLVDWAVGRSVPFIAGALTPTEVAQAWASGAAAVKIFPASIGGPSYIRSLLAPYPDLVLVPTGGIDDSNARAFLEAGAHAVGVGTWLTGTHNSAVVLEKARRLRAEVV